MTDTYPDIEIYIKRPAVEDIIAWLEERFHVIERKTRGASIILTLGTGSLEVVIVENAVKGGYASVWFKRGDMPWSSDAECTREAFTRFGLEVRCSSGPWQEGQDEGGWLRITGQGESIVNWLT